MSLKEEEILEEISGFIHGYLKAGKVRINSFFSKINVNISNLEQLLTIRFLLKEETKDFVKNLPMLLKRFKTTTVTQNEINIGEIRGQIDWGQTTKERLVRNHKDSTIFSTNESIRTYSTPENIVLKQLLGILYRVLFRDSYIKGFEKAEWFSEWQQLKVNIEQAFKNNIYLQRVSQMHVTNRVIQKTLNNRKRLYREAARLLMSYRKIINGQYHEEDIKSLLRETFIAPEKIDVLFELYWIVQIIKQNTTNSQLHLMDGQQNKVATWGDDSYTYHLYHDSTGSNLVNFAIPLSEIQNSNHPYLQQKYKSLISTKKLAHDLFGRNLTSHLCRGRPDFLIEVYEKGTNKLIDLTIGEVKNTSRVDYAITGLDELLNYIYLVKGRKGNYLLDSDVSVKGMLCVDEVEFNNEYEFGLVRVAGRKSSNKMKL
ncbi:hypothetical protein [Halalkalibacter nanhaiisediminis]|uniref:Uncharacterized protein n=1 Tax=Halalkalibacter nanhaiisediminis TaxID=688079 RepID=A0A562QRB1_9BACI|nr:hypothetical protein [Halalkalibacter nanhaiisediminis]TWI59299.1 hypothetical protein IQ10_01015 [Halalkalibacter nanhaiisediminis]